MKHYLDYNATAPIRPEVQERISELLAFPLNPSSVHGFGRKAKDIVDNARSKIAEIIGVFPSEVVFTASGTEANNWVMRLFANSKIFVSAIEHPSILKTAEIVSSPVTIPVTDQGVVDLNELDFLLGGEKNVFVSVMLANNETGVIQPIREIAELVHKREGILHCDAIQAFGKIPVEFSSLGCDLMTISAHKMGGPVGAAALIAKNNIQLYPLLTGGGQEANRRAGTENVAAIAGFAKAAELIDYEHMKKVRIWLDMMEEEIGLTGASRIIGRGAMRLPNTSCVTMPNISAETQLISFDLEAVAVSAGSACSSGRIEPSHVLKAMGLPKEEISTAIRISGGWATKQDDTVAAAGAWKRLFRRKHEHAA